METAIRFLHWCKFFYGNEDDPGQYWIRDRYSKKHPEICKMAFANYKYTLITTPRELAKTTLVAILMSSYRIVYNMERFIVVIGKTGGTGKRNLKNIRGSIAANKKIKAVYGNLVPPRRKHAGDDEKREDSAFQLTFTNGVRLRSIGMGGTIRSEVEVYRPTLIILEDPEDVQIMREVTTLEQHQEFFDRDVMFSLDSKIGKILVIGNNLGIGCTVNNLLKDDRFKKLVIESMFENGRSIWEDRHPTKRLLQEEKELRAMGKGRIYDAERSNIPDDSLQKRIEGWIPHDCSVRREQGRAYLISDKFVHPIRVYITCLVDPAFSQSKSADKRAKVIAAIGMFPQDIDGVRVWSKGMWILDYDYDHSDPSLIPEWVLQKHQQWLFDYFVIEANAGQVIFENLTNRGLLRSTFYLRKPFTPIYIKRQEENKGDRIWNVIGLMARYGQFFVKKEHVEIINELDNFGYLIRKRGIHLLDACHMGLGYVPDPPRDEEPNLDIVIPTRFKVLDSKRDSVIKRLAKKGKAYLLA